MKRKNKRTTRTSIWDRPRVVRPAYRSFAEIEAQGAKEAKCLGDSSSYAINAGSTISSLYMESIGKPPKFHCCWDESGEIVFRQEHKSRDQLEAATDLINVALDAVKYVGLLWARQPDLCRKVARTLHEWPVAADVTEVSWHRDADQLVRDLQLGGAIEGFNRAARTGDRNPIRMYASWMFKTLSYTRHEYRDAEKSEWRTREGCPSWAAKTLNLPLFTREKVRAWADLGKEMLLQQRPNFLDDEPLKQQKFKWTKRAENRSKTGTPTLRAIQNEAFDDFAKELRKLAPVENVYAAGW